MAHYGIEILGLTLYGYHGVFAEERRLGQEFIVDLWLEAEAGEPLNDAVDQVLNYGEVAQAVAQRVTGEPVELIETLALQILDDLSRFERLKSAKIRLSKPNPPVPLALERVAVLFTRSY
ncbi:MAG: dihydroneopterin aldolase [bacterium]|nr:dihydroneopterin aldolase [bacterium]